MNKLINCHIAKKDIDSIGNLSIFNIITFEEYPLYLKKGILITVQK